MAEGWAKHFAPNVEIFSAGTVPAGVVNPLAVMVMAEKGIDLGAHTPKTFDRIPQPIDLIVAVCSHAADNCPVIPGATMERWDLDDPAAFEGSEDEKLKAFRTSRDDIELRVLELVTRLSR